MICRGGTRMVMRWIGLSLALSGVSACDRPEAPQGAQATAESLVYGVQRCRTGTECPTGTCSFGTCQGYLTASSEVARDALAGPFRSAVAASPVLALEVAATLTETVSSTGSDPYIRGRAADAFRLLAPEFGRAVLPQFLEDPDEPVRFFAARALTRLGDPAGEPVLRAFLDHRSPSVRELAREALAR